LAQPTSLAVAIAGLFAGIGTEEALGLNSEENDLKNKAKPWFSNRQLSTGFGSELLIMGALGRYCCARQVFRICPSAQRMRP